MRARRPITHRWSCVAVSALVLCGTSLQAQSRYRNNGYEFDWFAADIKDLSLGVEVEAESEESRYRNGSPPYRRDYVYLAPTVGFELDGSVYHPNLLYFDVKTEDGVSWQQHTLNRPNGLAPAGTETKTEFLGRYDAELVLLNERPYVTTLTAVKDHNFRQYDFFNRATVDTERYGARSGYAAGPVPFSVDFRDWTEDVSSPTRPSHLAETTLSLDARNERARGSRTTLTYNLEEYARRELGFLPDEGTFHTVNAFDTENFGTKEQLKLNSTLLYRNQETLTIASQSLNLGESLIARHSDRLQSDYTYGFDMRSQDSTDALAHSGQAALHHRLFENLNSAIDVHTYSLDSSSPDATLAITRYGVGWNESYSRHLSRWGRLTLGTGLLYDQERRETSGQSIYIVQEAHTLTDGVITYLNQPRAIASTVRVTDPNGKEYQMLLDYVLIEHGELMEIRRALGASQIPNGGAILVDYQVRIPPSDEFSTLGGQFSIRLDLFNGLIGLYARLNRVSNHGGESLVLQDLYDQVFGVDLSWHWARAGAEYEIYDSNLAPFESVRLFQSLNFELMEASSLSFNFTETWTSFPDTDIKRKTADAITRLRTQITSHLAWDVEGGVRLDRGPGFDQTLFLARTAVQYTRGQLAFQVGYEFRDQDYLGDTNERHFFFLRARRHF